MVQSGIYLQFLYFWTDIVYSYVLVVDITRRTDSFGYMYSDVILGDDH